MSAVTVTVFFRMVASAAMRAVRAAGFTLFLADNRRRNHRGNEQCRRNYDYYLYRRHAFISSDDRNLAARSFFLFRRIISAINAAITAAKINDVHHQLPMR